MNFNQQEAKARAASYIEQNSSEGSKWQGGDFNAEAREMGERSFSNRSGEKEYNKEYDFS